MVVVLDLDLEDSRSNPYSAVKLPESLGQSLSVSSTSQGYCEDKRIELLGGRVLLKT